MKRRTWKKIAGRMTRDWRIRCKRWLGHHLRWTVIAIGDRMWLRFGNHPKPSTETGSTVTP